MGKIGAVTNPNACAEVSPTKEGKSMTGLNTPTAPTEGFNKTTSKAISNMIHTLSEMPDGKLPAMTKPWNKE